MNPKFLILALSIALPILLIGQFQHCAIDDLHQNKFQNDFQYFKNHKLLEEKALDYFTTKSSFQRRTAKYTLPVVVHIIHDNGPENIPDNQVEDAILFLNQAFENVRYYNQQTGVDTEIQFCLARSTPQNDSTTGIVRVQSLLTEFNYTSQDIQMKSLSRWNPLEYINIYVVREICSNNGCGVAGYAYFPSSHGQPEDGVVLESNYMGNSEENTSVLAHELGHYLGLYHTFQNGCFNNDCLSDGDRVCDTPPDNTTSRVPCTGPPNSCRTDTNSGLSSDENDMINNYMDYSNLECYNAFTDGQKERMHFFIEEVRTSLLDSRGCKYPCPNPVMASFLPNSNQTILTGETINFTNNSQNSSSYNWLINGQSVSTDRDFSFQFTEVGVFKITLIAEPSNSTCSPREFSIMVNVECSVTADFSASALSVLTGESINFTNQSQNGSTYQWSVNAVSYTHLTLPTICSV